MTVEEAFDVVPGSSQLEFEFYGTLVKPLSVDPAEYKGLRPPVITQALMRLLAEIAPGVSFAEDDFELAAGAIAEANGESAE